MSTLPPPTFATLLRRARRAAGLSQEALAERAGISVDAISTLERGLSRTPHQDTLERLTEALGLSAEEQARWELAVRGKRLPGDAPEETATAGTMVPFPPERPGQVSGEAEQALVQPGLVHQPPAPWRLLPAAPTALIGREQEVQDICALLQRPEVRLLTLTGSAGVGKTSLALVVAADLAEAFADGVACISLAALADPDLVLPTIAEALDVHESRGQPLQTVLETQLHPLQKLLVLDNFEQVIAAAPHLAALLAACPQLKLLVTSREVLRLRAEQQFTVPPLALPTVHQHAVPRGLDLDVLGTNPAVRLFLQRAQAAQPQIHLTGSNAATIAEICRRLDGLPLALELAAPRLKLLSPQALLARLSGRLQMLSGGARDLPERQRTIEATIGWSYDLLTLAEQALFRRLSVFMNGWTLAAAEQVCPAAGALELDVLEGLAALLDKSLLLQEDSSGEVRYRLLYVLREFGLEQLEAAGELDAVREAHAVYSLALAEQAESPQDEAASQGWADRLEQEHDNLRAALTWWLERAERTGDLKAAELALRLCAALSGFWSGRFHTHEGLAFQARALALRGGVPEAVQVKVLLKASYLHILMDELERGEAMAQEALALARKAGDLPNTAEALMMVGWAATGHEALALARASMEEAAALYQQAGDAKGRAGCLQFMITTVLPMQGEYEQVEAYAEEALAIFRAQGDQGSVGFTLINLGNTLFYSQRDPIKGAALVEQGLALLRQQGAGWGLSVALDYLYMIRLQQGKVNEARALLEEVMALDQNQAGPFILCGRKMSLASILVREGELDGALALYLEARALLFRIGIYRAGKRIIAEYLEGRASLEVELGRPETAARLWGAAEALREAIGAPMDPLHRAEEAPVIARVRTELGEAAFTAVWAEGRQLTPEAALAATD
jgi:predicted ATPase/transcriptional regulator with XRE-family HTH domain